MSNFNQLRAYALSPLGSLQTQGGITNRGQMSAAKAFQNRIEVMQTVKLQLDRFIAELKDIPFPLPAITTLIARLEKQSRSISTQMNNLQNKFPGVDAEIPTVG